MQTVFQAHAEDHVTPLLKLVHAARLAMPDTLPPLPAELVRTETGTHAGGLVLRILPTSGLLAWLAELLRTDE